MLIIADAGEKSQKRVFIGLLVASAMLIFGAIIMGSLIYFNKVGQWHKYVLFAMATILTLVVVVVTVGIFSIVMTLWDVKKLFGLERIMGFSVRLLFPMALMLGEILNIPKDVVKCSYIEVSNNLTKCRDYNYKAKEILILAPHCIQWWNCPYKVTSKVSNCHRCGRCDVDRLLELSERRGIPLAVVTGGTLARQKVKELRPKAIIAIACERDLTEGMLDISPIPVMGVINIRPQGPCKNTCVDIKLVDNAANLFLGRKELAELEEAKGNCY